MHDRGDLLVVGSEIGLHGLRDRIGREGGVSRERRGRIGYECCRQARHALLRGVIGGDALR